ncbi:metalloregulator ArsR/SmtB family transcription factor [Variovorax dokdonensis]|uniref:Metalloregulator ArsR/SmtB family transcription factor n=1 Tax=Variovorax dokdonensis TaxID=344883 RepID=A0ABT7NDN3_9BURK|nr:metalloregulator ArsR/SmtB family transcription factor [Variovorax dokdonensis]MDM0046027.1 metalloregulator ArsR/SmtB family transcription factor [Variovorax dokdonensis]
MVEFNDVVDEADLDRVFAALADRTRRGVLQALGTGEHTVSELAEPHGMSLTGFMKHLRVLEDAGLVARTKQGRVVSCVLSPAPLQEAAVWLSRYEQFWTERFDALGRYLDQQKELQACPTPPPTSAPSSGSSASSKASTRPRSGARGQTRKR